MTNTEKDYHSKLVNVFVNTNNTTIKKIVKRRLKIVKCMFCDFPVGGSFETFAGSVICCACYYEIGSDGG
jgi:hypothetical protein